MSRTRREAVTRFLPRSPLPGLLGTTLTEIGRDRAELKMPYRPDLTTIADVVHGGAIATLLDTTGMVAAWADDTEPGRVAGASVALSISYIQAARAADLHAIGTVVQRTGALAFVQVEALQQAAVVATAQLVHRFA